MSRYPYQDTVRDGAGRIIASATVNVYDADTTDVATMYDAKSGGNVITSITTNSSGYFIFYIDDTDYVSGDLFDVAVSKSGYNGQTYPDILVF